MSESWQAEKSAITRKSILSAAIDCIVRWGYSRTTTSLIANHAKVSRGAMMHHFPCRASLIEATIALIQDRRLAEYRELMANVDLARADINRSTIEASIQAAWQYVQMPSAIALQEVVLASRTDASLQQALVPLVDVYESQFSALMRKVFPHWRNTDILETANDLVQFVLTGMVTRFAQPNCSIREQPILAYLADSVELLYQQAKWPEQDGNFSPLQAISNIEEVNQSNNKLNTRCGSTLYANDTAAEYQNELAPVGESHSEQRL